MKCTKAICIPLLLWTSATALGQWKFEDDFDAYGDDFAFERVWQPDLGDGNTPTGGPIGILIPRNLPPFPPAPIDNPPELEGQGIALSDAGGINEVNLQDMVPNDVVLIPTDTEVIRYGGDIFDDGSGGNKRLTIGLRNDTVDRDLGTFGLQAGVNFVELGYWNADVCDATDAACDPADPLNSPSGSVESSGFAYRVILFGGVDGELVRQPNWQYFPFDLEANPELDTNEDGIVNPNDFVESWHRFSATIGPDFVSVDLDLQRDGTIDSSVTWEMTLNVDPANEEIPPFTSLRIGGASGVTMNSFSAVDNVFVELAPMEQPVICGDFDMDGDVDVADRNIQIVNWTGAGNVPEPPKTFVEGDCDGDGDVDSADQLGTIQNWTGAQGGVAANAEHAELKLAIALDNVGSDTEETPFQIGQTGRVNQRLGPPIDLGNAVFQQVADPLRPSGYPTLAEYAGELGVGSTLDLRAVPEPEGFALLMSGWLLVILRPPAIFGRQPAVNSRLH